jgi:hypothetical protein
LHDESITLAAWLQHAITLAAWLQHARQFCSAAADRKGLITIRDCRDIVHALYGYDVRSGLVGRKYICTNLIIARLPGFEIDHAGHENVQQLTIALSPQHRRKRFWTECSPGLTSFAPSETNSKKISLGQPKAKS